jgi:hypothetical protein
MKRILLLLLCLLLSAPANAAVTATPTSTVTTNNTEVKPGDSANNAVRVNVVAGGAGDGSILDGVSSSIKATVRDYANSNPVAVVLTDSNGDFAAAGAGTQYTEGDTDASITGTAVMMEVAADTLEPVQGTVADGLLVNLGGNNDVTVTGTVTANAGSGTFMVGDGAGALNTIVDSGTLTANIGTTGGIALDATLTGGTQKTRITDGTDDALVTAAGSLQVDGSGVTQPISAVSLPLPTGAATSANQSTEITSLQTIDDIVHSNDAAIASTAAIGGQFDDTVPGTTTENGVRALRMSTRRELYSQIRDAAGNERGVNVTTANALVVDGSAVTQPVSGTVTATQATATSLKAQVFGDDTTQAIDVDASGQLQIDVLTLPSVTVGTFPDNEPFNLAQVGGTATVTGGIAGSQGVGGLAATDAAVSGNPVLVAGRSNDAVPTEVSADGEVVPPWLTRKGAVMTGPLPHIGLVGDPFTLNTTTVQYTTTQTGAAVITPTASNRLVVTKVQIQVGGTTAGTAQLWFESSNGDTTYTRGTDDAIFDGEFAPSSTLKPGVVMDGPWIAQGVDFDLRFTDSAAINPITITVWYYQIQE